MANRSKLLFANYREEEETEKSCVSGNWIEGCVYLPAKEKEGTTDDDMCKVTGVRQFSTDEG